MSEVGDLLRESMALHNQSKSYRKVVNGKQSGSDKPRDWSQLAQAKALRVKAHELDPQHADPAWQDEQRATHGSVDTHEALMAFYRQKGV